jgi:hypothetical protein
MAARTALILPFTWEDDSVSAVNWTEKLLKRSLRDKQTGRKVPLWELNQSLPLETAELSAHFRQIVGWNEEVRRAVQVEAAHARRRLDLPEASPAPAAAEGKPPVLAVRVEEQQSKGTEETVLEEAEDVDEDAVDAGEGEEMEDSSGDEEEQDDEAAYRRKMEVWKCSRLRLTAGALAAVFPEPALWAADMQSQSNTVAFDNSSHLAFLTSTTNLLQQPHASQLDARQPGHPTPGQPSTAAAGGLSVPGLPRSRSASNATRPRGNSVDSATARAENEDLELEEEKGDSDDSDDAAADATPSSKLKPAKTWMRRAESQRPVTPLRMPTLASTMPDSPYLSLSPSVALRPARSKSKCNRAQVHAQRAVDRVRARLQDDVSQDRRAVRRVGAVSHGRRPARVSHRLVTHPQQEALR